MLSESQKAMRKSLVLKKPVEETMTKNFPNILVYSSNNFNACIKAYDHYYKQLTVALNFTPGSLFLKSLFRSCPYASLGLLLNSTKQIISYVKCKVKSVIWPS